MIVDVHAHLYPEAYIRRLAGAPELALAADAGGRVFRYQGTRIFSIPEPNRPPERKILQQDVGEPARTASGIEDSLTGTRAQRRQCKAPIERDERIRRRIVGL